MPQAPISALIGCLTHRPESSQAAEPESFLTGLLDSVLAAGDEEEEEPEEDESEEVAAAGVGEAAADEPDEDVERLSLR